MAIRVEKLHGDLTTRPAPPFKRDRRTLLAEPLAHGKNLLDRSDLESNMVQLRMARLPRTGADQRYRMMIGMAAQERKATGLEILGIDFVTLNPKACV
jgi:hypothetical protein